MVTPFKKPAGEDTWLDIEARGVQFTPDLRRALGALLRDEYPQFVEYERAARRALIERDPTALDDRVHRALGVLRACRQLSLEESIKFLARVRLGVALGRIEGVSLGLINQLLLQVQPAHLSRATGCALGTGRDDRGPRADFVRSSLR